MPSGYNTFQIDNHYARLLCEKSLAAASSKEALPLIEEAKKIVFVQMKSEVRHYPYRVALGFYKCYERFMGSWTAQEASYFMRIFQEIKERCERIKGPLSEHQYVVECLKKANEALNT